MAGGILQLVSNSASIQNKWLTENPNITFFKKVYRRHTPFATEMVKVQFDHSIDFGQSGNVRINTNGDLVGKMFFVVDIPKLNAQFTKTKSNDILDLVNNSDINNLLFSTTTKKLTDFNNQAEVANLMNILQKTLNYYENEITLRGSMIDSLQKFKATNGVPLSTLTTATSQNPFVTNPLLTLSDVLVQLDLETDSLYNFIDLKLKMCDIFTLHKSDYNMIYQFLKFIYQYKQKFNTVFTIVDSSFLTNILLYSSVFYSVIPHREILLNFYLKNLNYVNIQNQSTNSLIETFDIQLQSEYAISIANLTSTYSLNQLYNASNALSEITNKSFIVSPLSLDTHTLLKDITFSFDNDYSKLESVQKIFYSFGPGYLNTLNNYNLIIKIINNLTTTNPIVVVKAFQFNLDSSSSNPNIYNDSGARILNSTYYPTIIDPNFKNNFINKINDINSGNTLNNIYQNQYANSYLNLINLQLTVLFNNIRQNLDNLFEKYRNQIFTSTDLLYVDYSLTTKNDNVYNYTFPTQKFQDNKDLRISNVFNLNVWFFNFFTYLNKFDAMAFSKYITEYSTYTFTLQQKTAIELLLKNINQNIICYMNDISQRLNTMYESAPSSNLNDSMKNYVPHAYSNIINGVNVIDNLLAVTIVYYRNHNPTILEMFEFIYYLCDNAIIPESLTDDQMMVVRTTTKLVYYNIYAYFMNVYDSFIFEAQCKYTTSNYDTYYNLNALTQNYVNYFLNGSYIDNSKVTSQEPLVGENNMLVTPQMEFYFVAETIHIREISKLYYNCLLDTNLILANVGQTTYEIISNIIDTFIVINNDTENDTTNRLSSLNFTESDGSRLYYDALFRQNIDQGKKDNLYYVTFTPQYTINGNSLNGYLPRDYEDGTTDNVKPINTAYYQNKQVISDYSNNQLPTDPLVMESHIPVYWVTSTDNIANTQAITTKYQLFDIDFFRIRHKVFFNLVDPPVNKSVDIFQLNLLKLLKLIKRLLDTLSFFDYTLIYQLSITLEYIIENINPDLSFNPINTTIILPLTSVQNKIGTLNTFYTIILKQLKSVNYTSDLTLTSTTLVYNICYNLFASYNNVSQINGSIKGSNVIRNNSIPNLIYDSTQLSESNIYIYNTVLNGQITPTNNILNKVGLIRDNFVSQYFYYVKYEDSIVNIYKNGSITNDYTFSNMSQIAYGILSVINYNNVDLSLFKNMSPLVLLYPDIYPEQLKQITDVQLLFDDFSKNISTLVTSYLTKNYIQRLTFKDVFDTINFTFYNMRQLCVILQKNNLYNKFVTFISGYTTLFNYKTQLFNSITTYLNNIINSKTIDNQIILLTQSNLIDIANIASTYNINFNEYYNYLNDTIIGNFNTIYKSANLIIGNRLLILNVVIFSSLDYFLIKNNLDNTVDLSITFKSKIAADLTNLKQYDFNEKNDAILNCLNYISNDYYPFLTTFITNVGSSNLLLENCTNPLMQYNKSNFVDDYVVSSIYYNSYSYLSNVIEYFIDYISDWALSLYNKSPHETISDFNYTQRFSLLLNEIHLKYSTKIKKEIILLKNDALLVESEVNTIKQQIIDKENITKYFNKKKLSGIYSVIQSNLDVNNMRTFATMQKPQSIIYPVSNQLFYLDKINEYNEIIDTVEYIVSQGIVLTSINKTTVLNFKFSLTNILYRNKKAKSAWIRKLGHYLIDQVIFKIDDQVCDSHTSDWLEIYRETTKTKGHQKGYSKMIGDLNSLTTFNDKVKDIYTITVPLIFYFNNSSNMSLPLIASINTKYDITIKLKSIHETTYLEQFASFVDDNNMPTKIKLSNCYLMCEYIYLTQQERLNFSSKYLEYLITDTQSCSPVTVSDQQLTPIYKIGTIAKSETVIVDKIKTSKIIYDYYKGVFVDKYTKDSLPNGYYWLPRKDLVYRKIICESNFEKFEIVNEPLPNVDPLVHKKNYQLDLKFNNPTKSAFLLIKLAKHTQVKQRLYSDNYFYGERQWDNYSLYPKYDLSLINNAKNTYYNTISSQIILNKKFDFSVVVLNLINIYTNNILFFNKSDDISYWVSTNLSYFFSLLNNASSLYNTIKIIDKTNVIRLKENLLVLKIDYYLYDYGSLIGFLANISNSLQPILDKTLPDIDLSDTNIYTILNRLSPAIVSDTKSIAPPTEFLITKTLLKTLILQLYYTQINTNTLLISKIEMFINLYYDAYNESQIDLLVDTINDYIDITLLEYNIVNIIYYFSCVYKSLLGNDKNVLLMALSVYDILQTLSPSDVQQLNKTNISNIFYKNILYNIFNSKNSNKISGFITTVLSTKLNYSFNTLLDTEIIDLIDYDTNLKQNDSINPLIDGTIELNSYKSQPENSNGVWWSDAQAYTYFNHTPTTGINIRSWSLNPLDSQPQGSINLSRIDSFKFNINLHPLIGNDNPASINTILTSQNLVRYMSGMGAKSWQSTVN